MRRTTKILFFLFLILLLLGGFFGFRENCWAVSASDVIINELMWAGSSLSIADEFVELLNTTDQPIDVSDWNLSRLLDKTENLMLTIPAGSIIPARGYFLIANYREDDAKSILDIRPNIVATVVSLANDKLQIALYKGSFTDKSNLIDTADDGTGNPLAGENEPPKKSMERNDEPGDGTEQKNWHACFEPVNLDAGVSDCSTPKAKNSTEPPPPLPVIYSDKIRINEILPNPSGNEATDEFIELYNFNSEPIDLEKWQLKDKSGKTYAFPKKIIGVNEYLSLYSSDTKIALNNSNETIYLLDPNKKEVGKVYYLESAKEDVSYNFDDTDWHWSSFLTPGEENKFEKKFKISIVKIKANPKGNDTDKANGEEIYIKNNSKKKVNLKTWSIATGSKTLANHPITKDLVINPGKTKKITRKYSLFTLNNKKGIIELRYPNGEVASRVKYDKKKESVKDDEVYELSGKKWQWNAPAEEIPSGEVNLPEGSSAPEENSENINPETDLEISDEEIALNLGKYSSENKIALAEIKFKSTRENILQSRETPGIVLGAFSSRDKIHTPVEIKSINSWQKTLQKSNQLFNFLINQFIRLI